MVITRTIIIIIYINSYCNVQIKVKIKIKVPLWYGGLVCRPDSGLCKPKCGRAYNLTVTFQIVSMNNKSDAWISLLFYSIPVLMSNFELDFLMNFINFITGNFEVRGNCNLNEDPQSHDAYWSETWSCRYKTGTQSSETVPKVIHYYSFIFSLYRVLINIFPS